MRPAIHADDVLKACLDLDLRQEELLRPVVAWSRGRLASASPDEPALETILLRWQRATPTPDAVGLAELAREAAAYAAAPSPGGSRRRNGAAAAACLLLLAGALGLPSAFGSELPAPRSARSEPAPEAAPAREAAAAPAPAAAASESVDYRYEPIDEERLKSYLRGRDSMLADDPYFRAIVGAAERHDVHPLLLFAITGQEQGFVPASHEHAERIASNPFNVYGSWENYRTDIGDAASLAAKLVAKRLAGRPEGVDPIQWINRKYAEDPNWWKGVSWFFEDMERQIERDSR
ncbi:MAG TPA: hypothetical protein VEZ72_13450 [Paenibacillus sp.]|nr:hypothetical protein [Paenibacillus sp.]